MPSLQQHIQRLKQSIPEVSPQTALDLMAQGALLIDVRERDEIAAGSPTGARPVSRGYLELRIGELAPNPDQPLLLICGSGTRSLFAADSLKQLGYHDVRSVAGGFKRWHSDGLPYDMPRLLDSQARERYARQIVLPEIGEQGQQRLLDSKVLLIGAGGLGSPAAMYLAAAGVGTLGIVDSDRVERSNLHRQVLHTDECTGNAKVVSARAALEALNPSLNIVPYQTHLDRDNAEELCASYDVIVDGSDNFTTRYAVNDACVALGVPDVYGSIHRFEGQASVFWRGHGPCYRCLYPEPPPPGLAPPCSEAGVLGVLPGVIGLLLATETLKILLGIGEPLTGRLLRFDALAGEFRSMKLQTDPQCPCCASQTIRQAAS
ncbi:MAG TPA: molybdopterin-synthase adenylyltransferase MoeB [Gammaproteobacteria bacterium]|nr:molybdopterin-synthase adenylyltransferase MoeB [Gammaproteobacteria bacterium]